MTRIPTITDTERLSPGRVGVPSGLLSAPLATNAAAAQGAGLVSVSQATQSLANDLTRIDQTKQAADANTEYTQLISRLKVDSQKQFAGDPSGMRVHFRQESDRIRESVLGKIQDENVLAKMQGELGVRTERENLQIGLESFRLEKSINTDRMNLDIQNRTKTAIDDFMTKPGSMDMRLKFLDREISLIEDGIRSNIGIATGINSEQDVSLKSNTIKSAIANQIASGLAPLDARRFLDSGFAKSSLNESQITALQKSTDKRREAEISDFIDSILVDEEGANQAMDMLNSGRWGDMPEEVGRQKRKVSSFIASNQFRRHRADERERQAQMREAQGILADFTDPRTITDDQGNVVRREQQDLTLSLRAEFQSQISSLSKLSKSQRSFLFAQYDDKMDKQASAQYQRAILSAQSGLVDMPVEDQIIDDDRMKEPTKNQIIRARRAALNSSGSETKKYQEFLSKRSVGAFMPNPEKFQKFFDVEYAKHVQERASQSGKSVQDILSSDMSDPKFQHTNGMLPLNVASKWASDLSSVGDVDRVAGGVLFWGKWINEPRGEEVIKAYLSDSEEAFLRKTMTNIGSLPASTQEMSRFLDGFLKNQQEEALAPKNISKEDQELIGEVISDVESTTDPLGGVDPFDIFSDDVEETPQNISAAHTAITRARAELGRNATKEDVRARATTTMKRLGSNEQPGFAGNGRFSFQSTHKAYSNIHEKGEHYEWIKREVGLALLPPQIRDTFELTMFGSNWNTGSRDQSLETAVRVQGPDDFDPRVQMLIDAAKEPSKRKRFSVANLPSNLPKLNINQDAMSLLQNISSAAIKGDKVAVSRALDSWDKTVGKELNDPVSSSLEEITDYLENHVLPYADYSDMVNGVPKVKLSFVTSDGIRLGKAMFKDGTDWFIHHSVQDISETPAQNRINAIQGASRTIRTQHQNKKIFGVISETDVIIGGRKIKAARFEDQSVGFPAF